MQAPQLQLPPRLLPLVLRLWAPCPMRWKKRAILRPSIVLTMVARSPCRGLDPKRFLVVAWVVLVLWSVCA